MKPKMDNEDKKHQDWLNIYLPFFVRFSKITEYDPKEKNHEYFKTAIGDLEQEYTKKEITVLSVFRDVMKEHVEGRKHEKIWYMNHAINMNLIPERDNPSFWLYNHCSKFLTHVDKINEILDQLKIEKVEPFKPLPPKKTRQDLKTEQGRKLYDLMDKWIDQVVLVNPTEAMGLAMMSDHLLEHEDKFFIDGQFNPKYKFWWSIGQYVDEDPEIKKIYFEDTPPESPSISSSEDEDEEK